MVGSTGTERELRWNACGGAASGEGSGGGGRPQRGADLVVDKGGKAGGGAVRADGAQGAARGRRRAPRAVCSGKAHLKVLPGISKGSGSL